jgi:hypothetical protein
MASWPIGCNRPMTAAHHPTGCSSSCLARSAASSPPRIGRDPFRVEQPRVTALARGGNTRSAARLYPCAFNRRRCHHGSRRFLRTSGPMSPRPPASVRSEPATIKTSPARWRVHFGLSRPHQPVPVGGGWTSHVSSNAVSCSQAAHAVGEPRKLILPEPCGRTQQKAWRDCFSF